MGENEGKTDLFCNYRAFGRKDCIAVPIRYSRYDSPGVFVDGMMFNRGTGGIYFETDKLLPPGADIYIRVINGAAQVHGNEDLYRGHVMWCRKIVREDAYIYGVGVRFLINTCSECEDTIPYDQINRTLDYLHLCPDCTRKLDSLQDGHLRRSIEEYLQGNII